MNSRHKKLENHYDIFSGAASEATPITSFLLLIFKHCSSLCRLLFSGLLCLFVFVFEARYCYLTLAALKLPVSPELGL